MTAKLVCSPIAYYTPKVVIRSSLFTKMKLKLKTIVLVAYIEAVLTGCLASPPTSNGRFKVYDQHEL